MNEANFISMLLFDSLNWLADVASYFPSGCFCTMRPNTFSLSPTSFISSKKKYLSREWKHFGPYTNSDKTVLITTAC